MRWSRSRSIRNWNLVPLPGGKMSGRASKQGRRGIAASGVCVASLSWATLTAANAASVAPRELHGKSVVVSWTETRSQRLVGEQSAFRPFNVSLQRSIYVSTTGRPFSRLSSTASGGRGSMSGTAESVGAAGSNFSGGARSIQFRGNSIVMTTGFNASARQVVINFSGGFQNCNARVITAKEVGAKTAIWRGVAAGRLLEVESVSAGPASCSVKDGNVFAD